MKKVDDLKMKFADSNWSELIQISDELVNIGGENVVSFFIEQLSSSSCDRRNAAALGLREIGHDSATKFLIDGVLNPIEHNQCGTLAYALEKHDCSMEFVNIFRILFYSNYECKLHAHNILNEQEFVFTNRELFEVKSMWNECQKNPKKYPGFEELKDCIEEDVDSFLGYLSE